MSIKLRSGDNEIFEVDMTVVNMSETIRSMLEDMGDVTESVEESITLSTVPGRILSKVIEWAIHHKDDPTVVENDDDGDYAFRSNDIPEWDQEFFKVDQPTLFEIIIAAGFLEIKGLELMACKTVADMMVGKNEEEIRTHFNIENDLDEENEHGPGGHHEPNSDQDEVLLVPSNQIYQESECEDLPPPTEAIFAVPSESEIGDPKVEDLPPPTKVIFAVPSESEIGDPKVEDLPPPLFVGNCNLM